MTTSDLGGKRDFSDWPEGEGIYHHILSQCFERLYIINSEGSVRQVLSGCDPLEQQNDSFDFLGCIHPDQRHDVDKKLHALLAKEKSGTLEFQWFESDHRWVWREATVVPFPVPDHSSQEKLFALAIRNIEERKAMEQKLLSMAYLDPLTELPNRRQFEAQLKQSLAYAKRTRLMLAVLCLDIDDFKLVNDSFGHETGDHFLKTFARRVKRCIREIDTFARMGGDEFMILLPQVDTMDNLHKVIRRIMSSIRKGWQVDGHQLASTISMGVAVFPNDGQDVGTLFRHVDEALYRVKKQGRNGYSFYSKGS